ncbi:helix-turn-helix domain-containing protein [Pokkaliibacter plantistimulans]|nr:AraC family transcriptional regulator [Pokkaliibacter plantistimulans]
MPMDNSLSIRTYTKQQQSHAHDYHQLVLPIRGVIAIELEGYAGKVGVGECVVIQSGRQHHFRADEAARFIVADLLQLPDNLYSIASAVFSVSAPMLSFLFFAEKQLEFQVDEALEASILQLFMQLLARQGDRAPVDQRIRTVQAHITGHLASNLQIAELAEAAHLSPTQFKKLFREALGSSVHQYITQLRMEKARALLTHTDLPVQLIAEQVGYNDVSAFIRRFTACFGMSPRAFAR